MIRKMHYANQGWYPNNALSLKKMFTNKLSNTNPSLKFNNIKGIISPHAGYIYSLKTAISAFNYLTNHNFNNTFIIAPSHKSNCNNKIILSSYERFETPFGNLSVNDTINNNMISKYPELFSFDNSIHDNEHSLEMQLPLISFYLNQTSIIPIIIPSFNLQQLEKYGTILSNYVSKDDLLIMSSDLSHFPNQKDALIIDKNSMNSWLTLDVKKIFYTEEKWSMSGKTSCAMCGISSIICGIKTLKTNFGDNLKINSIDHSTSYEVSNDDQNVVGYGSAILYE